MSDTGLQAFFLALCALFSIVNPIGGAFIFSQITAERTHAERAALARRIALYAVLVMLVALWAGAPLLAFFGISLPALRIGGGIVVAASAWSLLSAPEHAEARKEGQAASAQGSAADVAFFPLTMPFTTGPGTISVAIALRSQAPVDGSGPVVFVVAASAAAVFVAISVGLAYTFADRLTGLSGRTGARVVTRLSAFLLLCVGVEIVLSGVTGFVSRLR